MINRFTHVAYISYGTNFSTLIMRIQLVDRPFRTERFDFF